MQDIATRKNHKVRRGHFSLSNDDDHLPNNGAILTITTIIKAVMTSAAEAELGVIYLNAKEAVYLCQILTKNGSSATLNTNPNHI
jgi:hypothetical protein